MECFSSRSSIVSEVGSAEDVPYLVPQRKKTTLGLATAVAVAAHPAVHPYLHHREVSSAATSLASLAVSSELPDLPGPAVASILQHMPLRQRLNCCALVCCSWAAAAAAAPADVCAWLPSSERREQVQGWLDKHAGVVASLKAHPSPSALDGLSLGLPVAKLTQLHKLHLTELNVTSSSSGSSDRSTVGSNVILPMLRKLKLVECELTVELLSQLLSPTTLSKMYCELLQLTGSRSGQILAAVWQRLQQLPQLSELTLRQHAGSDFVTAADVAPLSNLRRLQHLDLRLSSDTPVEESMPRELLAALQHLTQLRHLQLSDTSLHWVRAQQQQDGSYQCFSVLTASTQLTALVLEEWVNMPVPQAAFAHMFCPGRVLPHLKMLRLVGHPHWPCVGATQVAMIAASCPALQQLTLQSVTRRKRFDAGCLAQLPAGVTRVEGLDWNRSSP